MAAKKKIRMDSDIQKSCDYKPEWEGDMKSHKQKKTSLPCNQCHSNFKSSDFIKTHKRRNQDGEVKFWLSPELVSHLLLYLDISSTMALAIIHPLTVSLLQNMFIWRSFMQRMKMRGGSKFREVEGKKSFEFEMMEVEVKQVVTIINLVEEPKPLLLDLVHTICKRFSSSRTKDRDVDLFNDEDDITIQLICEDLSFHSVTPSGFLLLRQTEVLTGFLVHKVEKVEKCFHAAFSGISGSLLTSLASLASSQAEPFLSLDLFHMNCNTREESLARVALLQQCHNWSVSFLDVKNHNLGADCWSALARAVARGRIVCLSTNREVLVEGRREDLKMVWDASTRWNVEGRFIDREIFWTEDEVDPKVGWEIIEYLLNDWTREDLKFKQEYEEIDMSDVTLADKDGKESHEGQEKESEEEESSEEELERSLAAEMYEEELEKSVTDEAHEEEKRRSKPSSNLEKPSTKALKGKFAKDNIHRIRKHWKFSRYKRQIKLWKKVWQPCQKDNYLSRISSMN